MSGGLDCTVATSIISKDHEIHAITFNYGQKALEREVKASRTYESEEVIINRILERNKKISKLLEEYGNE